MQREIVVTADGSHTVSIIDSGVTYHSHHGAIGESRHVYLQAALLPLLSATTREEISVLDIGFGTGLNALLSFREARQQQRKLRYTALELYPLSKAEISHLNHGELLSMQKEFTDIHQAVWEEEVKIDSYFTLHKMQLSILDPIPTAPVDCIFFDAFSPIVQPELWTQSVFEKMHSLLLPGGILVTYSSKSIVRKSMQAAGFRVTKIPGPWGKREMVRAYK